MKSGEGIPSEWVTRRVGYLNIIGLSVFGVILTVDSWRTVATAFTVGTGAVLSCTRSNTVMLHHSVRPTWVINEKNAGICSDHF